MQATNFSHLWIIVIWILSSFCSTTVECGERVKACGASDARLVLYVCSRATVAVLGPLLSTGQSTGESLLDQQFLFSYHLVISSLINVNPNLLAVRSSKYFFILKSIRPRNHFFVTFLLIIAGVESNPWTYIFIFLTRCFKLQICCEQGSSVTRHYK